MKLLNFIKTLLPHIEKNDTLEDLRVTVSELETVTIPSYESAADHFKINKIRSKEVNDLSHKFYKECDPNGITKQKSFIADISRRLENVKANAEYITDSIEKLFEHDIISEGLTVQKAILLRTAGDISFVVRYSTDLLNYIYDQEASVRDKDLTIPPIVVKQIEKNFKQFVYLISDLGMDNKKFSKILVKVPDVVITDSNTDNLEAVYRPDQLDPLNSSHITGFTSSPIYVVRLSIASWQAGRYKAAKNKKKLLELRLLQAKTIDGENKNAKLEKEIEYTQSRLDKINKQLADFEEELGD